MALLNLLIFILSPLLGFIISILSKKNKLSNLLFLVFFFLIGCSFVFYNTEVDSYRYALDFAQIRKYDSESILLERLLQGRIDFYDYLVCDIVSRFTESARLLFAVYAMIFGYFVLKYLQYTDNDWGKPKNIYVWILLLVIYFLNPHMNINGVRYWTATWMFFTSFTAFFLYLKKKWIWVLFMVPIVHISYLIPLCFIFISYIFLKHLRVKQLYSIVFYSFIIGTFLPINKILSILPTDFSIFEHFTEYVDEGYIAENHALKESMSFINLFFSKLPFVYVFLFYIFLKKEKININGGNLYLFTFVSLFLSFLFIFDKIPSLGRFYHISYMLLLYLTYRIYKEHKSKFIKKLIICTPILFFGIIYQIFVIHDLVLSNIYLYSPFWDIIDFAISYKLQ